MKINGMTAIALGAALALAGCNGAGRPGDDGGFRHQEAPKPRGQSIFDLFNRDDDANVQVKVNKYIWLATLDVLDFMPLESADPFTGVMDFGLGRVPGSGRAWRATVQISDPALDARSLNVALVDASGRAADFATIRAVEDAILTRARQIHTRDTKL